MTMYVYLLKQLKSQIYDLVICDNLSDVERSS